MVNTMAQMFRAFGAVPLFYNDTARLSPVYVSDVAQAIREIAVEPQAHAGKTFEIAGPELFTQSQLVDLVAEHAKIPKIPTVALNGPLSDLAGKVYDYIPDHFVLGEYSYEKIQLVRQDNLLSQDPKVSLPTELGIVPRSIRVPAAVWLRMWRRGSPFSEGVPEDRQIM